MEKLGKTAVIMKDTIINNKWLLATFTTIILALSTWGLSETIASCKDVVELKQEAKTTKETMNRHEESIKNFETIKDVVIELKVKQRTDTKKIESIEAKLDRVLDQLKK